MANLRCPHCNQPAMSTWRKWQASFAWTGVCDACGKPIGLPSWSFFAGLTIAALVFITFFFLPSSWGLVLVLVAAALQSAVQIYLVPIERREADT